MSKKLNKINSNNVFFNQHGQYPQDMQMQNFQNGQFQVNLFFASPLQVTNMPTPQTTMNYPPMSNQQQFNLQMPTFQPATSSFSSQNYMTNIQVNSHNFVETNSVSESVASYLNEDESDKVDPPETSHQCQVIKKRKHFNIRPCENVEATPVVLINNLFNPLTNESLDITKSNPNNPPKDPKPPPNFLISNVLLVS
ncbi:hypothetical protein FQA39_LY12422 [Lamprigera yunnana]|nr:hypothetical protein FQA39_LY12422 [Lamprigera yunnana]